MTLLCAFWSQVYHFHLKMLTDFFFMNYPSYQHTQLWLFSFSPSENLSLEYCSCLLIGISHSLCHVHRVRKQKIITLLFWRTGHSDILTVESRDVYSSHCDWLELTRVNVLMTCYLTWQKINNWDFDLAIENMWLDLRHDDSWLVCLFYVFKSIWKWSDVTGLDLT